MSDFDNITYLDSESLQDRERFWLAAGGFAVGMIAGLLLALWLIPDQPDKVIVPVEVPAGVQVGPIPEVET